MEKYKNLSGNSGVVAFEIGDDWIKVTFIDGDIYLYSYKTPGPFHVEQMKKLAQAGRGLSAYIGIYVQKNYEKKITI